MKNEPFIIERIYNAPVERVWKAITDKEQMKQWYFDIAAFKPEVGFEFQFTGQNEDRVYVHLCKITEVVINKKLAYSWRYDGYPGNSVVTFELFAEGARTRLRLTHEGLESFQAATYPDFAKENFITGWTEIIGTNLKEFVERTIIKKSVEINAAPEKVWKVLVDQTYTNQWANAFSEGAHVETNWQKGSPVIWKDRDGNVGAKGIVAASEFPSVLKVAFYDDVNASPQASPGESAEQYRLQAVDGKTSLSIEAGPLSIKEASGHEPLWDKAIAKMKELAESA